MRNVIVESPYAGDVITNLSYARACLRDCLNKGEAPYASHVLYAASGALDDFDPVERQLGLDAGFSWGKIADATVVYTDLGISPGMAKGIEDANLAGRPVEYRELSYWSLGDAVPIRLCADVTAKYFAVAVAEMKSPIRAQWITKPRHAAMFLARHFSQASLTQIGRFFKRDHSTVISAIERIPYWRRDEDYRLKMDRAHEELSGMISNPFDKHLSEVA